MNPYWTSSIFDRGQKWCARIHKWWFIVYHHQLPLVLCCWWGYDACYYQTPSLVCGDHVIENNTMKGWSSALHTSPGLRIKWNVITCLCKSAGVSTNCLDPPWISHSAAVPFIGTLATGSCSMSVKSKETQEIVKNPSIVVVAFENDLVWYHSAEVLEKPVSNGIGSKFAGKVPVHSSQLWNPCLMVWLMTSVVVRWRTLKHDWPRIEQD